MSTDYIWWYKVYLTTIHGGHLAQVKFPPEQLPSVVHVWAQRAAQVQVDHPGQLGELLGKFRLQAEFQISSSIQR
jgi:hypothetical protein